jgi:Tol biopolymer transport system component
VKISGPLVTGGNVRSAGLSPDGTWVVFQADKLRDEVFELFSVPLDGHLPPLRENQDLAPFGSAGSFQFSPDSRAVTYLARQDTSAQELYLSFLLTQPTGSKKRSGPP